MVKLAVLMSFSGAGGVERMVVNLLEGFVARGHRVDLLVIRPKGAPRELPEGVRRVELAWRTHTALPALVGYLRRERPRALLAAKDRAIRIAVLARLLSGVDFRLVGRLGTNLSAALEGKPAWRRRIRLWPMAWLYKRVEQVVAVSRGVAEDTLNITGLPRERVVVVRNPVITTRLHRQAQETVDHPWLADDTVAVVMGAGRLTRQKDFPTLIRAFAKLRQSRPARLIILGEGKLRPELEALARELGIENDMDMPGHTSNPYAWMRRARLFVLSSLWEGSPNVLTEALALGVPSVATDCPSGPREVLDGGRIGPLVQMGDWRGMAAAMARVLDELPPPDLLRQAVAEYTLERSARGYLAALGLEHFPPDSP